MLDVLSVRMFCPAGRFVPPDVLSLYVMSPDVLSGHRRKRIDMLNVAIQLFVKPLSSFLYRYFSQVIVRVFNQLENLHYPG
jgi:hypothetical protein